MSVRLAVVNATIRLLLKLIARVRAPGIARVPDRGPLIIAVNHINFLETPLIYILLRPRRTIGVAKVETWDSPLLRVLANLWEAIPIRRSVVDTAAFRRAAAALAEGAIVVMAPEGTRSRDGQLRPGRPGIVTLAARTGAPILPIVHFGGEAVWTSLRRLRRTIVTVRTGRPISVPAGDDHGRLPKRERDRYLDRVMLAMAAMLPERYRGVYRDRV